MYRCKVYLYYSHDITTLIRIIDLILNISHSKHCRVPTIIAYLLNNHLMNTILINIV